jgi:2-dehydropantoate 2-reductase
MSSESTWPRIAVIGAGAVGGYFGGMLARAGAPVVLIGRQPTVDAIRHRGLVLDTLQFQANVPVEASTSLVPVRDAAVVLFCVKSTANRETALRLAPLLAPHATVVSFQNGVDNIEQIRDAAGIEALAAAVYVAASVPEPGTVKHVGRGDLVMGPESETTSIAQLLRRANVPCRVTDNLAGELWTKLLANCALNAVSALGNARYGAIARDTEACRVVASIVDEFMAVARAAGVAMPGIQTAADGLASALKIASQMTGALSSTAQDLHRHKPTEIDSLNGYIARRGAELGVPTPVNQALYALVKLMEAGNVG